MTITANLKDDTASIDVSTEIETNSISISINNTAAGINIFMNNGRLTAYIYSQESSNPEIITLTRT